MDWLFERATIISLACIGGIASTIAWVLAKKGGEAASYARVINIIAYAFMGASVVLFIAAGFRGGG